LVATQQSLSAFGDRFSDCNGCCSLGWCPSCAAAESWAIIRWEACQCYHLWAPSDAGEHPVSAPHIDHYPALGDEPAISGTL
jgi:hypothetical protein